MYLESSICVQDALNTSYRNEGEFALKSEIQNKPLPQIDLKRDGEFQCQIQNALMICILKPMCFLCDVLVSLFALSVTPTPF